MSNEALQRIFGFRTSRLGWLVAGALALLSFAPSSFAEERPTTKELKAMPWPEANGIVRRDLLSILEPNKRMSPGIYRQFRDVRLVTRSVGTEYEGVCRRDRVSLKYTGATPGVASGDAPIRPYGIEALTMFHIVHLPEITKDMGAPEKSLIWQQACVDVDKKWLKNERARKRADPDADPDEAPDPAEWFFAEDAFHAVQAGFLLKMARAAVKSGTLKSAPCPFIPLADIHNCEEAILEAGDLSDIGAAESCPADAGLICYRIDFLGSGTGITIVARGDGENVVPLSVVSIAVAGFLIVDE
jgi:hypothetical protein